MFAKLSVLGLCLTVVSALQINVNVAVTHIDATVDVDVLTTTDHDPTRVDLVLSGVEDGDKYLIANDLAVAAAISFSVPAVDHPGQKYEVIATDVGNSAVVYATSVEITIEA